MVSKLDLYKVFCKVAVSNSFSEAAKDLYMTQPAVSQAIRQLEKELDTRLFKRSPKGVTLTNEGQLLFEYANSALNLLAAGEEKLLEFKNLTAGELKIGVGDTISRHFLLPYLESFHNRYPNIKFTVANGTTAELLSIVKSGEIDIAVCNLPVDDPSLEVRPCFIIHDTFVYGDKFKRILSRPLGVKELVKFPLIFLEKSSNSRQYVEEFLQSKGIQLSPEFELGSHDLVLEFAKSNLGIASVTREFSQDYIAKGLVNEVQLIEEIPGRHIGICYLKTVPLSPASTKFVEMVEKKYL
ncbi:LysR family transcriptional regulator [Sporosarcina sp. HYO08]|uniref:LysR family transcriptional regulator n=1 Tax=Sporosarcina sp. HYO08 TaxID=1759557 RepID=UPI00079BFEC7|nr:LysR family transcriptional regulator [Sporosarcina sp. HYO08]KXH80658.1 LysR family transcriptional regulator [Sporosarcina sp. HYO08]